MPSLFVTVGSQMPFDRLVRAVDEWVHGQGIVDIFAQIGSAEYEPRYMPWVRLLDPASFQTRVRAADIVIGHAGTGTILESLRLGKQVIVLPRRGQLRETRDDHQVATADAMETLQGVYVARDEGDIGRLIEVACGSSSRPALSDMASPELLYAIRCFLKPSGSRMGSHRPG